MKHSALAGEGARHFLVHVDKHRPVGCGSYFAGNRSATVARNCQSAVPVGRIAL
jgi:hypothetical protein